MISSTLGMKEVLRYKRPKIKPHNFDEKSIIELLFSLKKTYFVRKFMSSPWYKIGFDYMSVK